MYKTNKIAPKVDVVEMAFIKVVFLGCQLFLKIKSFFGSGAPACKYVAVIDHYLEEGEGLSRKHF